MNVKTLFMGLLMINSMAFADDSASRLEEPSGDVLVPRLNTNHLINGGEQENATFKTWLLSRPADRQELAGKRVAVLTTDGVEEIEILAPMRYLKERGAHVDLVAPRFVQPPKKFGVQYPQQRGAHILTVKFMENASWVKIDRFLDQVAADQYDAVIIPGGAWNPDALRADVAALKFVKDFAAAGKTIAAICHGPLVLVNADLVKGKRLTSYWNVQIDLQNAGGIVSDEAVVIDGNLITSRFPYDLPQFMTALGQNLLK